MELNPFRTPIDACAYDEIEKAWGTRLTKLMFRRVSVVRYSRGPEDAE